nr:collagen-like protein [Ipomoea batatas]
MDPERDNTERTKIRKPGSDSAKAGLPAGSAKVDLRSRGRPSRLGSTTLVEVGTRSSPVLGRVKGLRVGAQVREVIRSEVGPQALEVIQSEVGPQALEVIQIEVGPQALEIIQSEVGPQALEVIRSEVEPQALELIRGGVQVFAFIEVGPQGAQVDEFLPRCSSYGVRVKKPIAESSSRKTHPIAQDEELKGRNSR